MFVARYSEYSQIRPRIGVRCGCKGWYYPACREGPLSDGRPFFATRATHRGNMASYCTRENPQNVGFGKAFRGENKFRY
jgi:hypothetical protein